MAGNREQLSPFSSAFKLRHHLVGMAQCIRVGCIRNYTMQTLIMLINRQNFGQL